MTCPSISMTFFLPEKTGTWPWWRIDRNVMVYRDGLVEDCAAVHRTDGRRLHICRRSVEARSRRWPSGRKRPPARCTAPVAERSQRAVPAASRWHRRASWPCGWTGTPPGKRCQRRPASAATSSLCSAANQQKFPINFVKLTQLSI